MMNITVNHIPVSPSKRPKRGMKPTSITIHSTGNEKSTAKNERGWLTNPTNTRSASWHYVVDDCDIIEAIPSNEVAYHSGTTEGNNTSISIEMCESGDREKVIQRTKELVKFLMEKHNIRVIKRHYDWSKKNCPRIMNDDGKWSDWFTFLSSLFTPEPKQEKKVETLYNPNSKTLKESTEYVLYRMELAGDLTDKWRKKLLDNTLTESEAIGLLFTAVERGFLFNKYSNK